MGSEYAIKVMLSVDDWIYVTEDSRGDLNNINPVLFKSKEDAENFANTWRLKGKEAYVKVVRYKENENWI